MKNVLIVGAGRSGRGMLGELYDADGFHVTFADVDSNLCSGLKKQGYYTVQMTNIASGNSIERKISGFDVIDINKEYDRYIQTFAQSKYISTALMPEAFKEFAKVAADEIRYRRNHNITTTQYITLGANYVGLRKMVIDLINAELAPQEPSNADNVKLVMSIVNRKNLLPENPSIYEDRYRLEGDDKPVLRVDDLPSLMAEPDHLQKYQFEANLDAAMAVKIWTGNVVQCSMAFVALNKGMQYTDEAVNDPQAASYAYYASVEAYEAVRQEYGLPERSEAQTRHTVEVFKSKDFHDSLYRIAREPIRKFGKNDRFIGPALCCVKHGILPYYITRSLAYGFLYRNPEEPQTQEIGQCLRDKGIDGAIQQYCGLCKGNDDEKVVYYLIKNHYLDITKTNPLEVNR